MSCSSLELSVRRLKNAFDLIDPMSVPDLRNLKYLENTEHLNCPICQQPFLSPMTTLCGHTFCKECIEECFKIGSSSDDDTLTGFCPLDRTPIDAKDLNELFPTPLIVTNMVDDLRVYCLNRDRGCEWSGHRWEIDHHVRQECDFTRVPCNRARKQRNVIADEQEEDTLPADEESSFRCYELTERRFLKDEEHCVHEEYKCKFCEEKITKIIEESHLTTECAFNYSKCELCNNDMIPLKNLKKHSENCLKSGRIVCPAREIGCPWSGDTEPSLENHLLHGNCSLNLLLPYVKKLENRIEEVVDENKVLKKQINQILDGIVQGRITNLGYNQHIEEIGNFRRDLNQDALIHINYEVERLRSELEEKVNPFVEREAGAATERQNILNNLMNDNFLMKDEMNLQRALLNSVRKQVQFMLFRNRNSSSFTGASSGMNSVELEEPTFDLSSRSSSEERLNLKL